MCKCNPLIKTPFCGVGDCQWPEEARGEMGKMEIGTPTVMKNRLGVLIAEKELRDDRPIEKKELAKLFGISPDTLKRWIRNDVKSYDKDLCGKMAHYFELSSPAELFFFENKPALNS